MCPMAVSESEVAGMKETLQAQQSLLQRLYTELDQEREASSSAASEALSMILRLQGEKAAVKMEACQYKRLAEEKISHAECSLESFEDLLYRKEMEIASLEFQVQAYKCKLLSLGFGDSCSVPQTSSYWDQVRDLDEQVKEIAHCSSSSSSVDDNDNKNSVSEPDLVASLDIFEVPKLCCLDENKSNLLEPESLVSLECNDAEALVGLSFGSVSDSEAKFRDLCERVERLERERSGTSREIGFPGEEERELLTEIRGQLQIIRAEIQSLKGNKNAVKDDQQVHCLKEALLHFWF